MIGFFNIPKTIWATLVGAMGLKPSRAVLNKDFNFKENVVELAYRNAGHFSVADWTFLKSSLREMEPNANGTLLANYAENINLFIEEDTLDSFVKKIEKYPNLDVKLYNNN